MSINHYSSDQFPEAHLYWPSQYMMMESSSSNQNKSTFFSHLIPNNTNTTNSSFWDTRSQLYRHHHSSAVAGGGAGGSSSTTAMFNLNNEDEEELVVDEQVTADDTDNFNNNLEHEGMEIPKEPLFEKPLTPSDVGKLNRLVIPKQHAEKYFPLSGGGSGGGDSGEKGFLLSFEDEMGKSWRFRYSYWNSSQSYVLTKGWSRFVKEKRLDAGDFVLFSRHRADAGRLFIGWRRRNSGVESGASLPVGVGGGYNRVFYPAGNPYPSQQHQGSSSSSHPYQPDCLHAGSVLQSQTSTAAVTASGNAKRLRLFGVNLECQAADESEPSTPTEGSPMSSQGHHHHHHHHQNPYQHQYYSTHHNHMGQGQGQGQDMNFSTGDHVYRQG